MPLPPPVISATLFVSCAMPVEPLAVLVCLKRKLNGQMQHYGSRFGVRKNCRFGFFVFSDRRALPNTPAENEKSKAAILATLQNASTAIP
jgi:hypothetical protein